MPRWPRSACPSKTPSSPRRSAPTSRRTATGGSSSGGGAGRRTCTSPPVFSTTSLRRGSSDSGRSGSTGSPRRQGRRLPPESWTTSRVSRTCWTSSSAPDRADAVILRAPTLADVPALVEFFEALDRTEGTGASESEIRTWLSSPRLDPEANFRVLIENGRLVGWCDVWDQNDLHERLFLDARAHPGTCGVYPTLFDWGMSRARELAGEKAVLRAWGDSADEAMAREVGDRGFRLIRHFFHMEIDLAEEPAEPEWPDGIRMRILRAGEERAVYVANNDAFAD